MESIEIITLQRSRDFSRRMNATFEFIKQNFKSLAKALLFIAGPSAVLSSAIMATMASDFFAVMASMSTNPEVASSYMLSTSFWLQYVLVLVLFFISSIFAISTINNYVILYDERKTNRISAQEVWERVRGSFWMYTGTMFMFFLLAIVVYIGLIMISMFFALIHASLMFLAMLSIFGVLIYLMVSASLTFFIRSYEKKGFFESLSRSFRLISGKWWSTFGFGFVIAFIMYSIAGLMILPFYILMIVQIMHNVEIGTAPQFPPGLQWTMIGFMTIYYLVSILLNMLPNVAVAFQYFNLVELKEARGLISQFDSIGEENKPSSADEEY
jgi:hypothetical protein